MEAPGRAELIQTVAAVLLFRLGSDIGARIGGLGLNLGIVTEIAFFLVALYLLVDAVTDFELFDPGPKLKAFAVAGLALVSMSAVFISTPYSGPQTDIISFVTVSAELVINGSNPYTSTMQPAIDALTYATPTFEGEFLDAFSYPALSILIFIPQVVLGGNFGITSLLFVAGILLFLTWEAPEELSLLPFILIFANRRLYDMFSSASLEPVWILFLLLALKYWKKDMRISYIFLGLSFATKQIPWFIAPFLIVWIFRDEDIEPLNQVRKAVLWCGGSFLLPNLPFILLNPVAWVKGVFTPLGVHGTLYPAGSGAAILNTLVIQPMPPVFYSALMVGFTGLLLCLYYLYFERMKWVAWMTPMLILFFNHRVLDHYFIFFGIIAFYILTVRSQNE